MALERARSITVSVLLALCLATPLIGSGPSPAAAQTPTGSFTCRASAVNLLGLEPVVANLGDAPCADDSRGLGLPLPSLAVQAVSAVTQVAPGGGGVTSRAQLVGLDLALLGLHADLIQAEATVTCEAGRPLLSGTSTTGGLTVNGSPVSSTDPVDIPLPLGTLHLNHTVTDGASLTRRAVWLETALSSVVLGEARAGFTANPCAGGTGTITIVKVSQPENRQEFSFTGELGPFSLRDDGRSAGADRRTFSKPAGTYPVTERQPTGGGVREAWRLADVQCLDPDRGTTTDRQSRLALIDLDPGEDVVCTFTNENPALGAGFSGDVENPTKGLDPVVFKGDQGSPPPTTSRASVEPPMSPTTLQPIKPVLDTGGSASSAGAVTLVGLPLVAILAGAIWFLLAAARRRRRDETA